MADTDYKGNLARPHWGGSNADLDIHLEAYEGEIDGSFRVGSLFRGTGLTNYKTVQDHSNTYRGDRIGGVEIRGRRSGEKLEQRSIANEKFLITVDTTSYASTPIDYQDDWTAPDFQTEYAAEHGTSHSKAFDQAHIIQLIKASEWKAPASLKTGDAFRDGIGKDIDAVSGATVEEKASAIVSTHGEALSDLIKRDLGDARGEFITLIDPDYFNILLNHDKLMNVEFQGGNGFNDFAQRRIAVMNGIRVIETPRFPTSTITNHILGPDFNVTANQAKARVILFHPRQTLLTVEAQPMTVRFWDDKPNFSNVLDSYHMYTVGIRRGDASVTLFEGANMV